MSDELNKTESPLGTIPQDKALAKPAKEKGAAVAAAAPAPKPKMYKVVKTAQVPRGASVYTLPAGKVISSQGYHIDGLLAAGVELQEVSQ